MIGPDGWIDQWILKCAPAPFLRFLGDFFNRLGKGDTLAFLCIFFLILSYFRGSQKGLKKMTGGLIALTLVAPGVQLLKHLVGRARPRMGLGDLHFLGPNFFQNGFDSFPSGHAMASFSLASFLALCYPRWRILFYATAAAISLIGRVLFHHHYLTDVLAGSLLGTILGFFIFRKLKNWIESGSSKEEIYSYPKKEPFSPNLPWEKRLFWRDIFWILFLSGTILLVGLGRSALWDRDETEYAQATLEMAQKNEWLIPALEGKPFLEKPIFLYWMTRLSLHFFGTSEFAFRLPSALFGMGICAVTYILGALLWGHGPALFSASILATTFLFTGGNKLLMTDPFFLFFTTCSLLFYILSLKRKEKASLYFALNYCVLGLAVLCKGPIGLFPVPIFILWEWLMKEEKSWVRFMKENCLRHLAYLSLTLLISAPWFIYSSFKEKGEMSNFVIQENILRFMEGSEGHSHPFLYYIPILLLGFFPWTFFLISYFRKEWVQRRDQGIQMNSEVLLLTLWACFLYLFFSLSAHKLPHYLLPMLPPLSCLAGKFWHDQIQSGSFPKWPFTWTLAVSLCLFFLTVSIAFFRPQYAGFDLSFPFLVLSAGVGVGLYWISKNERQKSWLSLLTGSWAFYWALSIWALPQIDRQRVMKPIGLAIQKHVSSDDSLFGFRVSEPSLFIYGGRLFPKIENEPLDTLLNQEKKTFVLISEKQLEKSAPQSAYTILEKKEGFAENGGETTLLLISNQTPSKGQP